MDSPTKLLSKFGKKAGDMLKEERGSEYFSQLGKKSAQSSLRTKEYYSDLGKRSAASKKRKREEREEQERRSRSPLTHISNILHGKIAP